LTCMLYSTLPWHRATLLQIHVEGRILLFYHPKLVKRVKITEVSITISISTTLNHHYPLYHAWLVLFSVIYALVNRDYSC
jgi:hypothetical protein